MWCSRGSPFRQIDELQFQETPSLTQQQEHSTTYEPQVETIIPTTNYSKRPKVRTSDHNNKTSNYYELRITKETYPVQELATWRGSSLLCTSCWHL